MVVDLETVAADVIDQAFQLHRDLGPGLLETVYEIVLAAKLTFRIDLLIDQKLIVEIKSVERLTGAHAKQLLTYLRLTKRPLGLLINFGGETLKEGLRRVVNDYVPFAPSRLRVNQNSRRD